MSCSPNKTFSFYDHKCRAYTSGFLIFRIGQNIQFFALTATFITLGLGKKNTYIQQQVGPSTFQLPMLNLDLPWDDTYARNKNRLLYR
jgi:hypothetical protein